MELTQYLKGTLRWWWLIVLSTIVAGVGSYVASMQQPRIYQTTTTLMVGQVFQKTDISGNDFTLTGLLAQSYAQVTTRQPILQATVDSLGLDMSWQALKNQVYAAPIPLTQLLAISVQDVSPQRAVAIADEIAYQLILQSPASPENQQRNERSEFVHTQLDDLEKRISTAQARVVELDTELASALSARKIQDLQSEISGLENLINDWQVNYRNLLGFLEGGDTPNQLTIIEPAQLPYSPISPDVQTNVLLAAAVGFSLAFGAALLLEYFDNTVKSTDDLTVPSIGLTSLGTISNIDGMNLNDKLVSTHDLFSPITEAYRQIRTNIQFTAIDQPARSIMVTSSNPGEGKSTTAANLGIIMAQANLRTIIVDADLRRPTLHKMFQVPNLGGLTDLLSSESLDIDNQLKDTGIENLKIITSGPLPPNPSEILGSQRMMQLLQQLERVADIIIFDTPPILAVTDALVLSKRVDGVILVIKSKSTRRDSLKQSLERLNQVGAKLLGGVLNGMSGGSKGTIYHHYYTHSEQHKVSGQSSSSSPTRRWWQRVLPVFKS
ncbi:MAG: polysaccharide biosynthesis tyrosine autokinase [Anaerolineae bacterium]|nr:polysaccharide biosynthesis tyrosine autokinase [Anaerolineae bacterium]MCB9107518.1 polysaccharide biosynthesis tyrosine autokinase [Anaerolineales bacterium]